MTNPATIAKGLTAEQERAQIVAWLRDYVRMNYAYYDIDATTIADWIERGDHHTESNT